MKVIIYLTTCLAITSATIKEIPIEGYNYEPVNTGGIQAATNQLTQTSSGVNLLPPFNPALQFRIPQPKQQLEQPLQQILSQSQRPVVLPSFGNNNNEIIKSNSFGGVQQPVSVIHVYHENPSFNTGLQGGLSLNGGFSSNFADHHQHHHQHYPIQVIRLIHETGSNGFHSDINGQVKVIKLIHEHPQIVNQPHFIHQRPSHYPRPPHTIPSYPVPRPGNGCQGGIKSHIVNTLLHKKGC